MFCPKCRAENPNTAKFCKRCGKSLPDFADIVARTEQYYQAQAGLVGQVLDGKYRIDAKLGAGGMGDVYRATRLLMDDTIAIKTLHSHLAQDANASERFRREAITATKLRHKNVVTIYDVGISAAHRIPYILMELAEGYTLRQLINENKTLPLDFAVTVVAQVCSALMEAHQLGIIHRDIKPENIIANQTDTGWYIKVLDFGIAKLYNQPDADLTQDGSSLGTPQYMSPEQCLGEKLDARSDIYSIGITIYELLCGKPPFSSIPATAISIHQVQTPPTPPSEINPNIHPRVEEVILRALSKKREERQQTAQQLTQEFIQAATDAIKSATPSQETVSEGVADALPKEPESEAEAPEKIISEETESEKIAEETEPETASEETVSEQIADKTGSEVSKDEPQADEPPNSDDELNDTKENATNNVDDKLHHTNEDPTNNVDDKLNHTGEDKTADADDKEDLSQIFEDAEELLDNILVDSKRSATSPPETNADPDELTPISMPDEPIS